MNRLATMPFKVVVADAWLTASLLGTVASVGMAHAESDAGSTTLEEVVVTAERRATPIQKTPVAVTAIDAATLEERGVSSLRDIQTSVPNVAISANTGLEFPIAIRGISSSIGGIGADSPTAIYLDGVYIARPFATVFDLADIDRVEVLRGPQGTLYGRNSTSGAINVITRLPQDEFSGMASLELGDYGDVHGKASLSGAIVPDLVQFGIAGSYRHRDGFYHDTTTGQGGLNPDDSQDVAAVLAIMPHQPLNFILRADYATTEIPAASKELAGVFDSPLWSPATANTITANNPGVSHAESGGLSLTAVDELEAVTLKSISAVRFERVRTTNDIDSSAIDYQRIALGPEIERQFSEEFQIASRNWSHGSYIVGLYAMAERSTEDVVFEQFNAVQITPTFALDYYVNNASRISDDSYAAFGQVDYKLTPDLTATLGGRYSIEHKRFGFGTNFIVAPALSPEPPIIPVRPVAEPNQISDAGAYYAFTPKFGLSYQFDPAVFVYASVQRGFKSGGFSFSDGSAPPFGPEKIWSYEAGLKSTWFDRRLQVNLTGFYYDYTNLQVSLDGAPGQRFTANAANSEIKGVELEVASRPLPGLTVSGFLALLDATYVGYRQDLTLQNAGGVPLSISCPGGKLIGTTVCDLSGNHLPRAPDWSYTLSASYVIDFDGFAVTPQLTWHHEAKSFYSEQNVAPLKNDGIQDLSGRISLELPDSGWRFSAFGRNLTDYRYIAGALPVSPTVSGFSNWPRTFGVEASFTF